MGKITPLMQQYQDIKEQFLDCILFFRLGDFYEMFYEDAIEASRVLEITLTKKNYGNEEFDKAPMCGVPHHAVETYIGRLIANGYKVAVCEQMEDPSQTRGLVKREVIRVVTPGTVTGESMLTAGNNNFLAAAAESGDGIALVFCDISTGELLSTFITGNGKFETLIGELVRIGASEILIDADSAIFEMRETMEAETGALVSGLPAAAFIPEKALSGLSSIFDAAAQTAAGISPDEPNAPALYGLFTYLADTQKQRLTHIRRVRNYSLGDSMILDKASIRNLELTETLYDRQIKGSLLGILDKTHTAMGGRLMKRWIREPLTDADRIRQRLDAVEILTDDILIRNALKTHLKAVYDLERLSGRIAYGNANGRDLIALRNSAAVIPEIKAELSGVPENTLLWNLNAEIDDLSTVFDLIDEAIEEDSPLSIHEGRLIKHGFSEELEAIKESIKDGQQWIANLESTERERTGIRNLKVGYNKVFGYYIDITRSHIDHIPEEYIRKQTLVNNERYITPELKEVESVVLGAEAKIYQLEYEIFTEIRQKISAQIPVLQSTSSAIAVLDVLVSFAEVSEKNGYVKPEIREDDKIEIEKGRHPVIEQNISGRIFVPNDAYIDRQNSGMLLITGPNMAGKSTYMRMTALIVLMAQTGCFVPADRAKIGITDRIFTRIGASDNLARGESTFFVEMNELAFILANATEKSLVILDEIGRGTSTYDGLSIAWAVLEYLCKPERRIRTLFATHYHELTMLEDKIPGLINLNTDISDHNGELIFLHKIVSGSSSRSYGIHVAKLAGIPQEVLADAEEKLHLLENERAGIENAASITTKQETAISEPKQLSLFNFVPNPIVEKLKSINLMEIKPSKAFEILEELKKAAENE